MKKTFLILVSLVSLILTCVAYEQEDFIQTFGDRSVVEISVSGLRRTSETTFLNWLEIVPGSNVSGYNTASISTSIANKGLFTLDNEIEFYPTDDAAIMLITTEEKFSFFAVPFYNSIDGDKLYGGAILDSNFLGYGATLLNVTAFGKKDFTSFLLLTQDEMWHNDYSGNFMLRYKTEDVEMNDLFDNKYYHSKHKIIELSGTLGRKFLDKKLIIGPSLQWQSIAIKSNELDPLEADANLFSPGLSLVYDKTFQNFLFRDGFLVESLTSQALSLDNNYDHFWQSENKLSYSNSYKSKVNLTLKSSFGFFDGPDLAEQSLSLGHGTKSLPYNKIYADDWINGSLILEHTLISKHLLNPTLSYYYEGGYYLNDTLNEKYHGVGSEFKVYFDKVAIPALGFGLAYNFTNQQTIFTFSFGMGGE